MAKGIVYLPTDQEEDASFAINFGDKIAFCNVRSVAFMTDGSMKLAPVNTFDAPKGKIFNHMEYWVEGEQYVLATDDSIITLNKDYDVVSTLTTKGKIKSLAISEAGEISYNLAGETTWYKEQLQKVVAKVTPGGTPGQ